MQSPTVIVLDNYADSPVRLDSRAVTSFHNELQILGAWQHGLQFLYWQTRKMEETAQQEVLTELMGEDDQQKPQRECQFVNLVCNFHWYSVTLCNYLELVSCIGREIDRQGMPPRDHLKATIPEVLAYRNHVAAHVSRAHGTGPNAAERFASMLPPTTLICGRYHAGALRATMRKSGNVSSSDKIRAWSLTLTHEKLAPRYWPFASNSVE